MTTRTSLQREPYTLYRCAACGLTQKKFHEKLKTLYDPNKLETCCLRGAKFIRDKNTRDNIVQYNLKYPGPPSALKDEKPIEVSPQPPHLPRLKAKHTLMPPLTDEESNNIITSDTDRAVMDDDVAINELI